MTIMPPFDRTLRFFTLRSAARCFVFALCFAVSGGAHAAPSVQGQRVINKVSTFLRSSVSSPGGKLTLRIVPGAHPERGEFSEIFAAGRPAKVKKLQISEITLRARRVRIDVNALFKTNKLRTLQSQTSLRAVVTDTDLTRYLARGKSTRDMNLRVMFSGKAIRVTGNFNWRWLSGPVEALGRLRLGPDYKVYFDIINLKHNGNAVPNWVKTRFSQRINPLINYDDVPFRPKFKSLVIRGNRAILTA